MCTSQQDNTHTRTCYIYELGQYVWKSVVMFQSCCSQLTPNMSLSQDPPIYTTYIYELCYFVLVLGFAEPVSNLKLFGDSSNTCSYVTGSIVASPHTTLQVIL